MQKNNNLSFIKSDGEVIDFLKENIDNVLKRRNFEIIGEVYNTRNITECDRRILYRAYGVKSDGIKSEIEFSKNDIFSENAIKEKWLTIFEDILNVKVRETFITASDCNYNLIGEIDGAGVIGNKPVIFMIRKVNHEEFENISKNEINRKDKVDILAKMWMIEVKHGILLYEDGNTNDYQLFHVTPYEPIIQSVCTKCKRLEDHRILGKLPDRPYKDALGTECLSCEFKLKCWDK